MTFVDDKIENLETASALGFNTILFFPKGKQLAGNKHRLVTTFGELLLLL